MSSSTDTETPVSGADKRPRRVPTRTLVIVGLVVSLLLAGVVSAWASSHPDGLEHVASQVGFEDSAEDSKAADSPMADYQTQGVDDERVSGGLAGVVGVVVTGLVMGGLVLLLRRRRDP